MNEIWLPAPGFGDWLEVSNFGGIRTLDYFAPSKREGQATQLRRGVTLLPDVSKATGYPRIAIKRYGKTHRINVHRLVALAFVSGWFDGATVDHIDGIRTNNRSNNLRWLTRAENTRLQNADGRGVAKGQSHPGAKLQDSDIPQIFALRESGLAVRKIGERFGVSGSLIHKITRGTRRTHQRCPE